MREGTAALFDADERLEVVGLASDGREAIELAGRRDPDVVLLDLNMPGLGGLEACAALRERDSAPEVLMLTVSEEEPDLYAALRVGASGYLLKDMAPSELIEAVLAVARGEPRIAPEMASRMLAELGRGSEGVPRDPLESLSDREREVLALAADRVFTLRGLLPLRSDMRSDGRIHALEHLLQVVAAAVIAGRDADMAAWLSETRPERYQRAEPGEAWERVLYGLVWQTWLSLLAAPGEAGQERAISLIAVLRESRTMHEDRLLEHSDRESRSRLTVRLEVAYHLADAAAILAVYLRGGDLPDVLQRLARHFGTAGTLSVGNLRLSALVRWLRGAAFVVAYRRTQQLSLPGITS
jgi:DNA-binding NarL/FixJ family response regulator